MTTQDKITFLDKLSRSMYTQGDDYFVHFDKRHKMWHFGYTNDYPLQHGDGEKSAVPDKLLTGILNYIGVEDQDYDPEWETPKQPKP